MSGEPYILVWHARVGLSEHMGPYWYVEDVLDSAAASDNGISTWDDLVIDEAKADGTVDLGDENGNYLVHEARHYGLQCLRCDYSCLLQERGFCMQDGRREQSSVGCMCNVFA